MGPSRGHFGTHLGNLRLGMVGLRTLETRLRRLEARLQTLKTGLHGFGSRTSKPSPRTSESTFVLGLRTLETRLRSFQTRFHTLKTRLHGFGPQTSKPSHGAPKAPHGGGGVLNQHVVSLTRASKDMDAPCTDKINKGRRQQPAGLRNRKSVKTNNAPWF